MDNEFVSKETARLLQEKGYDGASVFYSDEDAFAWNRENYTEIPNPDYDSEIPFDSETLTIPLPHITLFMAMRWLRENYGLHCDIGYDDLDWFWNIISVSDDVPVEDRPKMIQLGTACHKTYEDACADAIKYCLENLL